MKRISTFLITLMALLMLPLPMDAAEVVAPAKGNVIISKVYYGRSKNKADNKNYLYGSFVEIYNNSASPVNVSGLKIGVVEADAASLAWTRDRMADAHPDSIAIRQVFEIPGTDKILEPGKSLLLVNSATDHTSISDFECDLTGADYEAKDNKEKFPNNSAVTALNMPYTYIASISYMLLSQTGACSLVLFTTDTDVTTLPTVFQYGKAKGNTNIIMPKSWVIDGVEIVSKGADASNKRLYDDIDKGFHAPLDGYTGGRIYRKTVSVEADGRKVLQDTDNTTEDFQYSTTVQPREYDDVAVPVSFDFATNAANWPTSADTWSDETGKVTTLTVDNVTLTSLQGDSYYPNILLKDDEHGTVFMVRKNAAFKLTAPEGKAVMKAVATMWSGSTYTFDLTASTGTVADNVWTGNATEVTFSSAGNRYIAKIEVFIADEDENTVKPKVEIVQAADIAAFNALDADVTAELTLTNARVNGLLFGAYYVEDATGATVIKGVELTVGTQLNGKIVGKKSNVEQTDFTTMEVAAIEYQLTAEDATTFTSSEAAMEGTVMALNEAGVQANYGKLVSFENVTITGTGKNKTLTDANNNTFKARDYMNVLPEGYTWPEKATKITGVVVFYSTGWFLMPISEKAIVAASVQPTEVTFNFADSNFRKNIGEKLTDVKGNIYNETFTVDNVSFQVTSGSAATKLYVDSKRGQNLVTYKEYATLTFKAPEGYAITQIAFTAAGSSNIDKFTASSGTISGMTWTGNADGVRFAQGGTSYLANAVVTLTNKTAETAALPVIEYTECANIADFNALAGGTYAKVKLTDAEVIGISADGFSTAWIQDATGGCWIQYCSLIGQLKEKTKINGTAYVVARVSSGNVHMKDAEGTLNSELTATEISDYTMVEGTLAEVNVVANKNKVVKISGASFVATKTTAGTLTQGENTIDVNNGTETANQQLHKIAEEWVKDETKLNDVTIVGILVGNSSKDPSVTQLLPISMVGTATGIKDINAEVNAENVEIYNLQGVRMNKLQKGLNIVNGRKVVIK